MSDTIELSAALRDRVGKGSARASRRDGQVPAVIYGDKKPPLSISVESKILERLFNQSGFFTHIFEIDVDGKKHRALARDAQLHPVKDTVMHVDFLRVSARTQVTVEIPVVFLNEDTCPGIKTGGVLNIVRRAIEVTCPANAIPERSNSISARFKPVKVCISAPSPCRMAWFRPSPTVTSRCAASPRQAAAAAA